MPLFLSFIISEEDLYKNLLITYDNGIKPIHIEQYNNDNYIETEELSSVDKSKIKQWLHWKDLSCRYDTYLFLKLFLLNYVIHKYKLSFNINAKKLYDLVESIDNIPEVEYKKRFWSIVENYHLDNINALSSVNGYKDSFPIENIFRFLNENNNFCIKLKIKIICSICNKIQDYDIFNSALIPITKADFNFINIYQKIMSLKLTKFGSCDICMKNINNNNDNNQYASLLFNCKTKIVLNLDLP